MKRLALSIIMIGILSACSNPKDVVIPSDTTAWESELKDAIKELPDDEKLAVAAYMMRAKVGQAFGGEGIPAGTTIGQAIELQKNYELERSINEAREKEISARKQEEKDAIIEQLNSAVSVTLLSKTQEEADVSKGNYLGIQRVSVGIQNTSEKEIAGVAGELKFIDIFDKEVGSIRIKVTQDIWPSDVYTWEGKREYNHFFKEHVAIWNLEDGKYTTQFVPSMIVFSDGTKLSVPE